MAKGKPRKTVDMERGRRLKECIEASGLSVAEFSDKVNMAEGSVRNIMSGQRNLTDDIAIRAAEILDVRPAYLLNLNDFPTAEAIYSHPYFPLVAAIVDAAKRNKARDLYLSSFHIGFLANDDLAKAIGVNDSLDHIEEFLECREANLIVDDNGKVIGHCSEKELSAFISDIDRYIEHSINKLIGGGFRNG